MIALCRNIILVFLLGCVQVNAQQLARTAPAAPVTTPGLIPWVPVKVNGVWGYADTSGQVKIEPRFNAAESFMGMYAVVQIGNKAFVIDTTGAILNPVGHDQIVQLEDSIFAVYKNSGAKGEGGWGAEKIGGVEILPMQYDQISRVTYTLFRCKQDTLMGFFNRKGVIVAPPKYDTGYVMGTKYVALVRNKLFGMNTDEGVVVLPDSCTQIKLLNNSTTAGRIHKKWGAGTETGRIIIPFEYDSIGFLSNKFVSAKRNDTLFVYTTGVNGHKAEGTYIHAIAYGNFWTKAYNAAKKCAIIDTNGIVIVQPVYDDVFFSGNGLWIVALNGKLGIVDAAGKVIVPVVYDVIQPFRNGMSIVIANGLQGVVNDRGELISPLANCSISIRGNNAKIVSAGKKVDFLKTDGAGNVIQRDEYEDVRVIKIGGDNSYTTKSRDGFNQGGSNRSNALPNAPPSDSLVWFYDPDTYSYGLYDAYLGDTVLPARYDFAKDIGMGYSLVGIKQVSNSIVFGGKQMLSGMLLGIFDDSTGKFAIEPKYTRLTPYYLSFSRPATTFQFVRTDGMSGLVRADGSERIMPASCIDKLVNGVAAFCVGGKWELEDKGECRYTWSSFANTYNIIGKGPFSSDLESKNAAALPVSHIGGKWGFMDAQGNILIEPQYEAYEPSMGNTCIVRLNKKWGLIDTSGKTIVPFEFDMMRYFVTKTDTLLQTQVNKIQMGCIDTLGNIVIPVANSKVVALGENRVGLFNNSRWSIARTNGQLVTEPIYYEVRPYSNGYAAVRIGKKWGLIDTAGTEVVPPAYDDMGIVSEGLCAVKKSSLWGYIDLRGSLVVDYLYTAAQPFFRGVAPVRTRSSYGLINQEGKTILKPTYALIERVPGTTVFLYRDAGINGLLSTKGKILTVARYNKFRDIGANRIAYQEGLYWGIMDTLGARLTNAIYDKVGSFGEGLCPVNYQGLWGFIDAKAQYRVQPQYRAAGSFSEGLAYVLNMKGVNGFIDTTGEWQVSIRRSAGASTFSENKTSVRFVREHKTHFSVYTRFGHRLTRDQFAATLPFYHGAAPVKAGVYWGLINFTGRYLLKPCYFQMSEFRDDISIVQRNCTFGLYSLNGQQLLAPEYDAISPDGPVVRIQRSNEIGYLHTDGRVAWPLQD